MPRTGAKLVRTGADFQPELAAQPVGAGRVVLHDVPPHCTAVGVPAKVVGCAACNKPSHEMDRIIDETDGPVT